MVTLETSMQELQQIVGKKLTMQELEDVLFDIGMELDDVQGDAIKVDITPDRPDMVSTHGLARVLRAYLGKKNKEYTTKKSNFVVNVDKSVESVRPYTVCAVVRGLKFDDEKIKQIMWVQEKLHATFGRHRKKVAIGVYPLEKITWPISYTASSPSTITFIPLGANKKMSATQILEEHATGKEYAHLLEGKKKYPYFIDANNEVLSMPPVINSENVGKVELTTKDVFVECSGSDLAAQQQTLNILCALLQDMGGLVYSVTVQYPDQRITTPTFAKEKRTITVAQVNKVLGTSLTPQQVAKALQKMMHTPVKISSASVQFTVHPVRSDIWHDVDIIDDVARAIGVNNLEPIMPQVPTTGALLPINHVKRSVGELLRGLGYLESFTLALTDHKDQIARMNLDHNEYIKLGHSAEQSINMVRCSILPELMKSLEHNKSVEYPQKLFEQNGVVIPADNDVLSVTRQKCAAVVADKDADFTMAKQHVTYLLDTIGVAYKLQVLKHPSFMQGRCAKIIVNKKEIGYLGEIHPQVLTNFGLEMPTVGFELFLDEL